MKILGNADRSCNRGPEEWFSGQVWVDTVVRAERPARLTAALVTFTPGARTAWHTHPRGQTLYVVAGLGWVQREGERAQRIRPGDVVMIAAGENHWHGAEAAHTLVHMAMQEEDDGGTAAIWGAKVTDQEYKAAG